jgi:hypothetical protein
MIGSDEEGEWNIQPYFNFRRSNTRQFNVT